MVTVVQGKVCAKNHPDRLSRLATIHQRYRQTDRRTDFLWHRPRPNGLPKTLKINTISDALCLLKITQLTPRNEHTVAAPTEQHLSVLNAKTQFPLILLFLLLLKFSPSTFRLIQ